MQEVSADLLYIKLKETIADAASGLFNVTCSQKSVVIGTCYGDVVLRCAHEFSLDANFCATRLNENKQKVRFLNVQLIESATAVAGFIDIKLTNEVMYCVAKLIVKDIKKRVVIEQLKDTEQYAALRAAMLVTKDDDFLNIINRPLWRRAYFSLLMLQNGGSRKTAAEAFIAADNSEYCYSGFGLFGSFAEVMLCYCNL